MKLERKAHLNIWLFTLVIVMAILGVCIIQIHSFIPKLLHSN